MILLALFMSLPPVAAADQVCPDNAKPILVSKTSAGPFLLVCGHEEAKPPKPRKQVSDFAIYSLHKKKNDKVFETIDTYWIGVSPDGGLELDELIWINGKPAPFVRSVVTCAKDGSCRRGPEKCVFRRQSTASTGAVGQLKNSLSGKSDPKTELDTLVERAFSDAMSGDNAAREFFLQPSIPDGLDGHAAEEFAAAKATLARAATLRCLPKAR